MQFADYTKDIGLFADLTEIKEFIFFIDIPPVDFLGNAEVRGDVVREMYSQMRAVVKGAQLYYEEQIKVETTEEEIRVTYGDDKNDFTIRAGKGLIAIRRSGSSFADFHEWYSAVMSYSPVVVQAVRSVIGEKTKQVVDPLRATFSYRFLLHDFTRLDRGAAATRPKVKNVEVLKGLLGRLPNEQGVLADATGQERNLLRVDVNLSTMTTVRQKKRNLWFRVEAPSNKGWKSLYLDFAYTAGSATLPDGRREAFDETACEEWDIAYTEFLRDIAIRGFLTSLLEGYTFRSSASVLP
jgi:hypothetical protein